MNKTIRKIGQAVWLAFSEADERYIDLVRVGYFLSIISFIGLAMYSVANGHAFGPTEYGLGIASVLFGGGAGIGARAKLEDGSGKSVKNEEIPNPVTQTTPDTDRKTEDQERKS